MLRLPGLPVGTYAAKSNHQHHTDDGNEKDLPQGSPLYLMYSDSFDNYARGYYGRFKGHWR